MMQLVGHRTWATTGKSEAIIPEHAKTGIRSTETKRTQGVLVTMYRELSSCGRRFLSAMGEDKGPSLSADVARRPGKASNYVSNHERRLLRQGAVEALPGGSFEIFVYHS